MKKVFSLVLVLMLAIGAMSVAMAEDTLRIGLSMHNQTADWAVQFKDTFLALGEENGIDVVWNDANSVAATQVDNIDDLLAQDIDVLVVVPADYTALGQALAAAKELGVKVVNADSKVVEEDQQFVDCFVTADCYEGGKTCGKYLAEFFPEGATIGGLNYPQIAVIADRFTGTQDAWDELGRDDLILIDKTCTDLNAIATYTEDMLMANPEIDGFVCLNDNTALSCYAACVQLDRPDCVVIGFDGSPAAKQSIANGEMTATLVYSPVDMATYSFDAAAKLARGEEAEQEVKVEMWMINPDNIAERDLENWE